MIEAGSFVQIVNPYSVYWEAHGIIESVQGSKTTVHIRRADVDGIVLAFDLTELEFVR